MTQVMQKCGYFGHLSTGWIEIGVIATHLPLHDFYKPTSIVENAYGMRKPRVDSTGESELGNTKLSDAAKSLKLRYINQLPRQHINGFVIAEDDQAMNRVPQTFAH